VTKNTLEKENAMQRKKMYRFVDKFMYKGKNEKIKKKFRVENSNLQFR